jgi:hypothetical protein
MDLTLVCDCLAPLTVLQNLRKAGIPSERRQMRRHPLGSNGEIEGDSLAGCGADFVVLLDGYRLIGILRKSQDDAVLGILQPPDSASIGLYRQLEMVKPFPLRMLILEGRQSRKFILSEPAICTLHYWCFRNHLFIFHTPNIVGTTTLLEMLFRKIQLSIHGLESTHAFERNP